MKKNLLYSIFLLIIACNSDNVVPETNVEVIPTVEETLPEVVEEETPVEEVLVPEEVFPVGSLNSFFSNGLISDRSNNIARKNPIQLIEYDQVNNRIKTNYSYLENLLVQGTNNQSWFVTQNAEASTVVEIVSVDITEGWIGLGNTYFGSLNTRIGATLEFFNPFVNYEIINDRPLFSPYPTVASQENLHYIQPGGLIEKSDGTFILLTPVVFGPHAKRSIYYASSTNLEDWTFHDDLILETMTIPFAKPSGNVFSTGNPYKLDDGSLLVLLGVQQPNNNYTSAYMILDEDLNILKQPTEIMIPEWNGLDQNSFPLSITKFNNEYRLLFHRRNPSFIDREIHEIVATDLFDALNLNQSIVSSNIIHKGNTSSGYLRGKADDAAYMEYNSELYILLGGEELGSTYLTSRNREYGLAKWNGGSWDHDSRSPLLVNPVQLHKKYPAYNWAWDHMGAFVSPIIKNNTLYVFMAFGTDNPDYFISGIKVSLN